MSGIDPADAIEQRVRESVDGLMRVGTVVAQNGAQVVVTVAGTNLTLPRLASYTPVSSGHTVIILAAAPGAWIVLGRPA